MKYFLIFLIFAISACKKEVVLSGPSFSKDPIHLDYSKKIKDFESEYADIKKGIDDARERINDSSFAPKLAELIKNEIFVQEKYLRLIEQEISFLKMKDNDRSKYYAENAKALTAEQVKKDHEDYLLAEKATPRKYTWRLRPGLILPPQEKPKEASAAKKKDGGH
ncbi:hypothetical protein K2X05_00445 [bacterium]|nr:hypothetical protein [bacterium]